MTSQTPSFVTAGFAHPEVLVSTDWVTSHIKDPKVRVVESDEDLLLYDIGHVPGAVKIDWHTDLQDPVRRDYLDQAHFEQLMSEKGIANDTTVVFYGDKNNWWACYAFWVFKLFGHADARIMDGGRTKWVDEGRPLSKDVPLYPPSQYQAAPRDDRQIRAFRADVMDHIRSGAPLVDVRSPQEFSGELLHMPGYPQEGALRGGHIPARRTYRGGEPCGRMARLSRPTTCAPSTSRSRV